MMLKLSKNKKNPNAMLMQEHTSELFRRLCSCLISFLIIFVLVYKYKDKIITTVLDLGTQAGFDFIYMAPQELLIQELRLMFTVSCIFCIPIFFYEVSMFVCPVFDSAKSKTVLCVTELISMVMFGIGALFAYKVLLPFTFSYLSSMETYDLITPTISVEKYISFFLTILFCIGLVFEIPVVSVMLAKLKLIDANIMRKFSKFVTIIVFIVAAIITPPDVISQILVAIPMLLLYHLSTLLVFLIRRYPNE